MLLESCITFLLGLTQIVSLNAGIILFMTVIVGLLVHEIIKFYLQDDLFMPEIHYTDNPKNAFIIKQCNLLSKPYRPPFVLLNSHVHIVVASLMPQPQPRYKRQLIKLSDGGTIGLDWHDPPEQLDPPAVFYMPGLTSDSQAACRFCELAQKNGFQAVVFLKRGHGIPLTSPKMLGFGDGSDLRVATMAVRRRFKQVFMIGTSAGSGLIASYCKQYKDDPQILAAAYISPGYDTEALMQRGVHPIYAKVLLKFVLDVAMRHKAVLQNAVDWSSVMRSETLYQFEERFYFPFYNFANMQEYWRFHNPMFNIEDIRVPTLAINALDDPICNKCMIPFWFPSVREDFMIVTTERGGHSSFLHQDDWGSWADKVSIQYLKSILALPGKMRGSIPDLLGDSVVKELKLDDEDEWCAMLSEVE